MTSDNAGWGAQVNAMIKAMRSTETDFRDWSDDAQNELACAAFESLKSPADAGVVTDEMVRRATDAFWSKEVRETENQTLRMRVALKAALSTKPEAGSGDYVRGLQRAAEIAMEENERRIALASIRVPAMAVEIRDAILKEATQPPTPASGEHMEVVAWRSFSESGGWFYSEHEIDGQFGGKTYVVQSLVTLDAAQKAITAANERAERLERERDEAEKKFNLWADEADIQKARAETAEALNTTLSEALALAKKRYDNWLLDDDYDGVSLLHEIMDGLTSALAALPAKQGGQS